MLFLRGATVYVAPPCACFAIAILPFAHFWLFFFANFATIKKPFPEI